MQWWYGHNAVAFFLTTPFLGLMYYFMPKAAERPVFSYRLSILHFWTLVFMYIWAGPHHLHYTALPEWASTLGMVFSVMLWAPSWGGMINGLLTLRGAWHKVAEDPVLKFFVVAVTAYGMATLRGPDALDQERERARALHRLDHRPRAHRRAGLERLPHVRHDLLAGAAPLPDAALQQEAGERALLDRDASASCSTSIAIYSAGVTQGLMWRAFDETGRLQYPDFVETVARLMPMYWMRVVGGSLYIVGMLLFGYNILMTWQTRPATYEVPEVQAAPLADEVRTAGSASAGASAGGGVGAIRERWRGTGRWERCRSRSRC